VTARLLQSHPSPPSGRYRPTYVVKAAESPNVPLNWPVGDAAGRNARSVARDDVIGLTPRVLARIILEHG
jgi:hypothetical protein